jgi:hypothetical protein
MCIMVLFKLGWPIYHAKIIINFPCKLVQVVRPMHAHVLLNLGHKGKGTPPSTIGRMDDVRAALASLCVYN